MFENTFVMIKPDGVERDLAEKIISRIKKNNLKIAAQKDVVVNLSQAEKLYEEHRGKSFSASQKREKRLLLLLLF